MKEEKNVFICAVGATVHIVCAILNCQGKLVMQYKKTSFDGNQPKKLKFQANVPVHYG